jgi:hypothetical protein
MHTPGWAVQQLRSHAGVAGDHDWYEPCKPALERDGLPWFYFLPSAEQVVPELREQYLRGSRALWGGQETQSP